MDDLSFDFENHPSWRSLEEKTTSHMLEEIAQKSEMYDGLLKAAHDFSNNEFTRAMAIDYIRNLNIGESVGTQSKDETHTLLECFLMERSLQLSKGHQTALLDYTVLKSFPSLSMDV